MRTQTAELLFLSNHGELERAWRKFFWGEEIKDNWKEKEVYKQERHSPERLNIQGKALTKSGGRAENQQWFMPSPYLNVHSLFSRRGPTRCLKALPWHPLGVYDPMYLISFLMMFSPSFLLVRLSEMCAYLQVSPKVMWAAHWHRTPILCHLCSVSLRTLLQCSAGLQGGPRAHDSIGLIISNWEKKMSLCVDNPSNLKESFSMASFLGV